MKIRKTRLKESELNIFIYENKKEEYFVVAIPTIEWSTTFTYDDMGDTLIEQLVPSLKMRMDLQDAEIIAHRLHQWTREM